VTDELTHIVILGPHLPGSNYFHNFPAFDPATFFTQLKNHTGHELVSTADQEDGFPIPDGLTSVAMMPKADYDHLLVSNKTKQISGIILMVDLPIRPTQANTKALIGIGKPIISPTPYASLCRGYVFKSSNYIHFSVVLGLVQHLLKKIIYPQRPGNPPVSLRVRPCEQEKNMWAPSGPLGLVWLPRRITSAWARQRYRTSVRVYR